MAVEALWRYKLRTFLSVLGVILGVAAVIAMMSVVDGARGEALKQVEALGLDNVVARNRGITSQESMNLVPVGLRAGDAERLLNLVPQAKAVSPLVERYLPLSHSGRGVMTRVLGVDSNYQSILRLRIERGRFLAPPDDRNMAHVCAVGASLARILFGYQDPLSQSVRIGADYYTVVGIVAEQGGGVQALGTLAGRDLGRTVLVPLSALLGRSVDIDPFQRVDEIWLQARDGERVEEVGSLMRHSLSILHNGVPDVDVVVPRELLAQRYRTQRTFSVVVGSVAVLTLLVGGIGIMNIMLTSVIERTTEIGIRRAVGATRKDVTAQFLAESLLMTLGGGALGIALGTAVSWGITAYAGWTTRVSPLAVFLGFFVSFLVGLFFGLYPAVKAAGLDPVDAVRYE